MLLLAAGIPFALILFFHLKQQSVRHIMKERLEEEILHRISLPEAKVHWVKKNKEILVNGKMFDVKTFYVENGYYKFTGLYDEEETESARQLENNFNKNNKTGSWLISNLFQWLQSVFPNETGNELAITIKQQLNSPFIYTNLTSPFRIILTPPPRVC